MRVSGKTEVIIEVEKKKGCCQETVANHLRVTVIQMVMLQARDEGCLLEVNLVI